VTYHHKYRSKMYQKNSNNISILCIFILKFYLYYKRLHLYYSYISKKTSFDYKFYILDQKIRGATILPLTGSICGVHPHFILTLTIFLNRFIIYFNIKVSCMNIDISFFFHSTEKKFLINYLRLTVCCPMIVSLY
jgi:hypothetical protein